MAWTIEPADDSRYLIMDKDRLVGSIARKQPDAEEYQEHFRVEITWSGTSGDITYEGNLDEARAFVEGVEAMFERVTPKSPEEVVPGTARRRKRRNSPAMHRSIPRTASSTKRSKVFAKAAD